MGHHLYSVDVEVNLRPTVSRPVCLGVRRPSGTRDQFFFLLEISLRQLRRCYFVAPSLTRGRVCNLVYNCFWVLPKQSLLGRSPTELTSIIYCLIWDSPNLEGQVPVFTRISPRYRWPSYTSGNWVPFFIYVWDKAQFHPVTSHSSVTSISRRLTGWQTFWWQCE
jgi:hypothetical protein